MKRRTILIAEDSPSVSDQLARLLSSLDSVEIVIAYDGLQAVKIAKAQSLDLILCDCEMPVLHGLQVLRLLRESWTPLELPILMVTGSTNSESQTQAFQLGANDYVTKPVVENELLARVRCQLDLKQKSEERVKVHTQMLQTSRLQAMGQLASGMTAELGESTERLAANLDYLSNAMQEQDKLLKSVLSWAHSSEAQGVAYAETFKKAYDNSGVAELQKNTSPAFTDSLEGAERMQRVLSTMSEFAGSDGVQKSSTDIGRILANTVAVSRRLWSNSAEVFLDLDREMPDIDASAESLRGAFLGLLLNAAESVSLAQPERGRIEVRSRHAGDGIVVSFKDNGSGVDEAIRDRIFDPFFSTKTNGNGSGQGLSMAHAVIVDQHQGRLLLDADYTTGAKFDVWLPLH